MNIGRNGRGAVRSICGFEILIVHYAHVCALLGGAVDW